MKPRLRPKSRNGHRGGMVTVGLDTISFLPSGRLLMFGVNPHTTADLPPQSIFFTLGGTHNLRLHIYDLLKPELKAFEDLFEIHFAKKGNSFQDMDITTIRDRMEAEFKELKRTIKLKPGDFPLNRLEMIRGEALDIALFGWFMAYRARREMKDFVRRKHNDRREGKDNASTITGDH